MSSILFPRLFLPCLLAFWATACSAQVPDGGEEAARASLSSPDGRVTVTMASNIRGEPTYQIAYDEVQVLGESRLGMRFADAPPYQQGFRVEIVETGTADETWEQPWGEDRFVRDHHNEMLVRYTADAPEREMLIRFRAFDDGVAFRYEFPASLGSVEITDELTEFNIGEAADSWWIPARKWNRYEYLYEQTPVADVDMVHTPFTAKTPDGIYIAIHEAALVDYAGMSLDHARPGVLEADLAPWFDGVKVRADAGFVTPWRTIQLGDAATDLLASHMILNLNEPNRLGDVSWVEPGKYIGIWWAMHIRERTWGNDGVHGATTDEAKRYIDFAAEHGFDGVLIEGWNIGWDGDWFHNGDLFSFTEAYPDFDIEAVTAYGAEKGVRLIGHHETSGNISNYEDQLEDAFDLYERLGVRQVKTGYVADAGDIKRVDENGVARFEYHDGQAMVDHHLHVVRRAAEHKISINAHEPVKDTGLRRTYPNWLTREGARGMEFSAWGVPPNPPEHTTIIPWTRLLSGPMDYTPGIFNLRPSEKPPVTPEMGRNDPRSRVETTLAKQLALYVTIYSPLQMAADLPEHYEERMDAFQFIKDVPADWEQSIPLAGEIGDYVIWARQARGVDEWYVGAITDEEPREVEIDLDFLPAGTVWLADIYRDGAAADFDTNPYDIVIEQQEVAAGEVLTYRLGPGGGAALRLVPVGGQ